MTAFAFFAGLATLAGLLIAAYHAVRFLCRTLDAE